MIIIYLASTHGSYVCRNSKPSNIHSQFAILHHTIIVEGHGSLILLFQLIFSVDISKDATCNRWSDFDGVLFDMRNPSKNIDAELDYFQIVFLAARPYRVKPRHSKIPKVAVEKLFRILTLANNNFSF